MDTSSGLLVFGVLGALILALLLLGINFMTRSDKQPSIHEIPTGSIGQPTTKPRGLLSRPVDWIALVFLIIASIWVFNAFSGGDTSDPGGSSGLSNPVFNSTHTITYKLSGSASSAMVTYFNAQGGMEQRDVRIPFQIDFKMNNYSSVSLAAQKQSEGGSLTCEILDNGRAWKTSTSTAAYGVVTCAGLVGQ